MKAKNMKVKDEDFQEEIKSPWQELCDGKYIRTKNLMDLTKKLIKLTRI